MSDFALKVQIEGREAVEHFWVADLRREGGRTYGLIGNDPDRVTTVRFGEEIEIPDYAVTDWLHMREGKMLGNFTLRPLFKQMPAAEVERLRSMMADPCTRSACGAQSANNAMHRTSL